MVTRRNLEPDVTFTGVDAKETLIILWSVELRGDEGRCSLNPFHHELSQRFATQHCSK